jgi:hypothetical protein
MRAELAELEDAWETEELLQLALVDSAFDTMLPELLRVIGRDKIIEFLALFEGCRIDVPDLSRLTDAARNASVFRRLESGELPCDVAVELDLTEDEVSKIFERMSALASCSSYLEGRRKRRRRQRDRKRAALAKAQGAGSS